MLRQAIDLPDKHSKNWKQKILGPSSSRRSKRTIEPTTPPYHTPSSHSSPRHTPHSFHTPSHSITSSPFLSYSRTFSATSQLSQGSSPFKFPVVSKKLSGYKSKSFLSASPDQLTPLNPLEDELDFHPLTSCTEAPFLKSSLPNKVQFNRHVTSVIDPETKEPHLLPLSRSRGPKIQPFIFSQAQQSLRKQGPLTTSKCLICEELLRTKLESELFVELECGEFVHGECLNVVVRTEFESMPEAQPGEAGCKFLQNSKFKKLIPLDNTLIDRIIENTFLQDDLSSFLQLPNPFNTPRLSHRLTAISMTGESFLRSIEKMRSPSPNPSLSTTSTVSVQIFHHKEIPVEVLKDHFVRYLLNCCESFSLSTLLTLGPLRLVDSLLVATEGVDSFRQLNCYLFSNYLVTWSPEEGIQDLFPLKIGEISIKTPRPNVVQIDNPVTHTQIYLHSEIGSIIEKWGVAISDPQFTFPSEILTSTIDINECKLKNYSLPSILQDCLASIASLGSTLTLPAEGTTIPAGSTSDMSVEFSYIVPQNISLDQSKVDQMFSGTPESDLKPLLDTLHIDISAKVHQQDLVSSDSDDDSDSDDEAIAKALHNNTNGWKNLHACIDKAILNSNV